MDTIPSCFYRVSVKALILNETRDKFLVCKESVGYWELPGGGLDYDTTPHDDLRREIMEEMGLKVTRVAENPSYFITGKQTVNPDIKIANVIYECEVEDLNFTQSYECEEIAFINAEDAAKLKVFDSVARLAELFKPENHLR